MVEALLALAGASVALRLEMREAGVEGVLQQQEGGGRRRGAGSLAAAEELLALLAAHNDAHVDA